ncbi:hypothetical protein [Alicyclobacillus sendaiensis]|uniref:Uncharacterized protein n=1 Tax=Alicyclobacillus sendaiensis PA2 TaxID=3029425 RepID=A0ABT6Y2K3_ALISE|nr:hypothetical protein [Alicyclobacillus sendaiensis]MDI9261287.1 hypothetical protein [Alicyclobacillus sendaiensis PA2]
MPKYKVTFVSKRYEEYEVVAANEDEAVALVDSGEVDPHDVWEVDWEFESVEEMK